MHIMNHYFIIAVLFISIVQLNGQSKSLEQDSRSNNLIQLSIATVKGNAPLYVLTGDIVSFSDIAQLGIGVHFQSDLSSALHWGVGLEIYNVASDFNLPSTGIGQLNIITNSQFVALPIILGTHTHLKSVRFELSLGLEYARLMSQKEKFTDGLRQFGEEIVEVNSAIIQRNNFQVLASFGISTPISNRLGSYIGLKGNLGLSDLDKASGTQQSSRYEFLVGLRYGLGALTPSKS